MSAARSRPIRGGRWQRPALAPLGAIVTIALLAGSAELGLRLPGLGLLSGAGDRTSLDYSGQPPNEFPRLRPGFIADVLGGLIPEPVPQVPQVPLSASAEQSSGPGPVLAGAGAAPVAVTHPFTNDDFAHAYAVPSVPFTANTNTNGATRKPGEPAACSPVGGVAWYRYTAISDRGLFADTFGSTYAVSLGVFEGNALGSLHKVGCDSGPTGNAQVGFAGMRGHTYYFQVTGPAGGGHLVFNIAPVGRTTRVTDRATGGQSAAPAGQSNVSMSADGRYVAFDAGYDLDPHHPPQQCSLATGQCVSIYVDDRRTGLVTMASVSSSGTSTNGICTQSSISASGRYVAFACEATNLVPGFGSNTLYDVYVHDMTTGITTAESATPAGKEGTPVLPGAPLGTTSAGAVGPSISADGRYVSFVADYTDLVPGNPCRHPVTGDHRGATSCGHAYLRDRVAQTTTLIDAPGPDDVGDGDVAVVTVISADGRRVLYPSDATNLVPGAQSTCLEQTDCYELYSWDVPTRRTSLVSVSSKGAPSNRNVEQLGMSSTSDGRLVAFQTQGSNLVAGDNNAAEDAFVRDLDTGTTIRASVTSSGAEVTDTQNSNNPEGVAQSGVGLVQRATGLSADGRYVLFTSAAPGLTPNATNSQVQVYRHDLLTGATTLASLTSNGQAGNGSSGYPSISADGSVLAFSSTSSNLATDGGCTGCMAGQIDDVFDHVIPENGE